ncbi:hypothetical protein VNI00_017148 [Paramarasmius palmivorus]|uniref:Uncharacterized protein n=1 Tax=Paramarasmius palmivorus TaxID=297713 RepID=A0AAW0B888_9AGAR
MEAVFPMRPVNDVLPPTYLVIGLTQGVTAEKFGIGRALGEQLLKYPVKQSGAKDPTPRSPISSLTKTKSTPLPPRPREPPTKLVEIPSLTQLGLNGSSYHELDTHMADESCLYRILRRRPGLGRDLMLVVRTRASLAQDNRCGAESKKVDSGGDSQVQPKPVKASKITSKVVRSKADNKIVGPSAELSKDHGPVPDSVKRKDKGKGKAKASSPDPPDEVDDFLLASVQPGPANFTMTGIQAWSPPPFQPLEEDAITELEAAELLEGGTRGNRVCSIFDIS